MNIRGGSVCRGAGGAPFREPLEGEACRKRRGSSRPWAGPRRPRCSECTPCRFRPRAVKNPAARPSVSAWTGTPIPFTRPPGEAGNSAGGLREDIRVAVTEWEGRLRFGPRTGARPGTRKRTPAAAAGAGSPGRAATPRPPPAPRRVPGVPGPRSREGAVRVGRHRWPPVPTPVAAWAPRGPRAIRLLAGRRAAWGPTGVRTAGAPSPAPAPPAAVFDLRRSAASGHRAGGPSTPGAAAEERNVTEPDTGPPSQFATPETGRCGRLRGEGPGGRLAGLRSHAGRIAESARRRMRTGECGVS